MTFNLQNLMDTRDDPATWDQDFVPAAAKDTAAHRAYCRERHRPGSQRLRDCLRLDWSAAAVRAKLRMLAGVVAPLRGGDGLPGPEVLVVQEVENRSMLERLGRLVEGAGYRAFLLEGGDRRGIDVGVLTRLPLAGGSDGGPDSGLAARSDSGSDGRLDSRSEGGLELILPRCPSARCGVLGRRGALSLALRLPGSGTRLRVLAIHLPSAAAPARRRLEGLRLLRGHMDALRRRGEFVVLAGDFNIPAGEERASRPYERALGGSWTPLHKRMCRRCKGTYYFGGSRSWNWFDTFVVASQALEEGGHLGWRVRPASLEVVRSHPGQQTKSGYPRPFRAATRWGVSDHFPAAFSLAPAGSPPGIRKH